MGKGRGKKGEGDERKKWGGGGKEKRKENGKEETGRRMKERGGGEKEGKEENWKNNCYKTVMNPSAMVKYLTLSVNTMKANPRCDNI